MASVVKLKFKSFKKLQGEISSPVQGEENRQEIIEKQNKKMIEEFNYLMQHDLLFYLTVIGDYELYKQYWLDDDMSEEEYDDFFEAQQQYHQDVYSQIDPLDTKEKEKRESIVPLLDSKRNEESLTRIGNAWNVRKQYESKLDSYHQKLQNASTNDYNRTGETLKQTEEYLEKLSRSDDPDLKKESQALRSEIARVNQESKSLQSKIKAESRPARVPKKATSRQTQQSIERIQEYDAERRRLINDFYEAFELRMGQRLPRANDVGIASLQNNFYSIIDKIAANNSLRMQEAASVEQYYQTQVRPQEVELKKAEEAVKEDNSKYLTDLSSMLKRYQDDKLPEAQKKALDSAIDNIQLQQQKLLQAEDISEQQEIMSQCSGELSSLVTVIQQNPVENDLKALMPVLGTVQSVLQEKSAQGPSQELSEELNEQPVEMMDVEIGHDDSTELNNEPINLVSSDEKQETAREEMNQSVVSELPIDSTINEVADIAVAEDNPMDINQLVKTNYPEEETIKELEEAILSEDTSQAEVNPVEDTLIIEEASKIDESSELTAGILDSFAEDETTSQSTNTSSEEPSLGINQNFSK